MQDFFSAMDTGNITGLGKTVSSDSLPWQPHPAFAGVALKHLISGSDTEGRFSAHLVRLDPDARIGDHVHETNWELHEVAGGSGYCLLDGRRIPYESGRAAILPEGVPHSVQAGEDGLCLLAKFVPSLL